MLLRIWPFVWLRRLRNRPMVWEVLWWDNVFVPPLFNAWKRVTKKQLYRSAEREAILKPLKEATCLTN